MPAPSDHDEVVYFRIPLDHATVARLMEIADACHAEPAKIAASMLHDVLKEDEDANVAEGGGNTRAH